MAKEMIRPVDKETAKQLMKYLSELAYQQDGGINREMEQYHDLVDRMVSNLVIAPQSYRKPSKKDLGQSYYHASCDKCGWHGSSRLLWGGGPIADTGDYDSCYCPVCGNDNV